MDVVHDFEDILDLFDRHGVRYLIVGGLAFIYHAKPRYTKDIDVWSEPERENLIRANRALDEVLQIGVAPNRIDIPNGSAVLEQNSCWPHRDRTVHLGVFMVIRSASPGRLTKEDMPPPKGPNACSCLRLRTCLPSKD